MNEAARLIDELTRAIDGDAWHGDPVARILEGVTAQQAAIAPGGVHSIWQIVRHMTAWTGEVSRRLAGHPAGEPQEGDWPAASGSDDAAWRGDIELLFETHRRLLTQLAAIGDEMVFAATRDPRNRATGAGVTGYVLVHGLAQHHAYHGGQMSLLKKLSSA